MQAKIIIITFIFTSNNLSTCALVWSVNKHTSFSHANITKSATFSSLPLNI